LPKPQYLRSTRSSPRSLAASSPVSTRLLA
jgi:hypothetical protein